jgi:hypothetical protein
VFAWQHSKLAKHTEAVQDQAAKNAEEKREILSERVHFEADDGLGAGENGEVD